MLRLSNRCLHVWLGRAAMSRGSFRLFFFLLQSGILWGRRPYVGYNLVISFLLCVRSGLLGERLHLLASHPELTLGPAQPNRCYQPLSSQLKLKCPGA
jgi:hypothetical protein